ncbi:STAS domain-containing protein [Lederbergia sp. NSJ-179]|uniref:STAS domain-containing protein n=1 Tax=Lederbergia sp. NSJ-179 TaxID=2931402 RepID=UPI001FD166D0|nr:STAS domain-containing protein [Lederbergia sp. NSJ-179]MCJ7842194.1 STAS domain-containing protein [Lederbergia sp. NSJ-179]
MKREIAQYIQNYGGNMLDEWMVEMKEKGDSRSFNTISDNVFSNMSKEFLDVIVSNIVDSNEIYHEKVKDFAESIIKLGWPLTYLTTGIRVFQSIIFEKMVTKNEYTTEQIKLLVLDLEDWLAPLQDQMIDTYSETWEKTISMQKVALQELSAPLIPVFEKISIMPLVGTIDTDRARLIMENLLGGAVKHRSDVVLIDITGVPVVDTMVAHHIIQAADAVRLVGAKCMIVGIRPEIAQTIVNLGINLNHITTTSTLRKGIEKALEYTNREIVMMEGAN